MTDTLLNFGAELDSDAAIRLLEHVFETNLNNEGPQPPKTQTGTVNDLLRFVFGVPTVLAKLL